MASLHACALLSCGELRLRASFAFSLWFLDVSCMTDRSRIARAQAARMPVRAAYNSAARENIGFPSKTASAYVTASMLEKRSLLNVNSKLPSTPHNENRQRKYVRHSAWALRLMVKTWPKTLLYIDGNSYSCASLIVPSSTRAAEHSLSWY